jgi:hypothetical protein
MHVRRDSRTLMMIAAIFGAVAIAWVVILWRAGWF